MQRDLINKLLSIIIVYPPILNALYFLTNWSIYVHKNFAFKIIKWLLQMILQGTQINYMPGKSHLIIIIINTQGQIVQIHLTRKNEIYACN